MKKIILILSSFLLIASVKALNEVPENIYYYDDNLYAILKEEDKTHDELYIEYVLTNETAEKTLELIKIDESNKIFLLDGSDEFISDLSSIKIKSRYLENEVYSEWSEPENVIVFDFKNLPTPEIANFNINPPSYEITNKKEIENYFINYFKVYTSEIEYEEEYRVNDGEWTNELKVENYDDVKVDMRVNYKLDKYISKKSNMLTYEKHPEVSSCIFGTDLCCNQIASISVCIWLFIIFVILVVSLIFIDYRKRLNSEA